MKEQTLVEMANKIETAGKVMNQMIGELRMMDERLHGLTLFIQKLPNYEEILQELKDELAKSKDEDSGLDIGTELPGS